MQENTARLRAGARGRNGVRAHPHTRAHAHMDTHIRTHTHTHTWTRTRTHTRAPRLTQMQKVEEEPSGGKRPPRRRKREEKVSAFDIHGLPEPAVRRELRPPSPGTVHGAGSSGKGRGPLQRDVRFRWWHRALFDALFFGSGTSVTSMAPS